MFKFYHYSVSRKKAFSLQILIAAGFISLFSNGANALWNGHRLSGGRHFTVLLTIHGRKQLDCSGVLIAPRLVMTAGHCLYGASEVTVRIQGRDGTLERIAGERWIVNPSWNAGLPVEGWDSHIDASNSDRYVDLSILLLQNAPHDAQPISLSQYGGPQNGTSNLLTYGYARGNLLEPLGLVDSSTATAMQRLSPRGPLKFYASGGSAWCQGDSGGPVTRSEPGGERLIGIVGLGLGAIDHDPSSALSLRWGGVARVPKCGSFAYVQDLSLHANWITQASAALLNDSSPFTASIAPRIQEEAGYDESEMRERPDRGRD